ncbi:MAG: Major outer membrane porin [Chlamydiales bacterium]|nr:Major outer membrane porin [Chlamydiales bacterium]MCH9620502.1 Major outer membrane porin [Chlamydiales bacterium]MCH9623487.1 Major outer membrane porin [Chlamydiales bacterium]
MKKLFLTMLTILTSGSAFALPLGNPSDASLLCDGICWEGHCGDMCDPCLTWCDAFSVRTGFYGDYVFNRHLEGDSDRNKDLDHSNIYTNAAFIAGNFWDRFDVFATFGTSKLYFNGNRSIFSGTAGDEFQMETETDFSWSVGARGTLWECGCTSVGAEFQYLQTRPHIKRISNLGVLIYPDSNIGMKWYEWQFGLGVSYRINYMVPYAGIMLASGKADFGNALGLVASAGSQMQNLETEKCFSYAIGTSLVDCEKMSLTVEVRFSGETAAYVNGQVRF